MKAPTPAHIPAWYHSWPWRQLRTRRRQLDGNTCVRCGHTDRLSVDHILPIADHWELRADISNLVTLCSLCHRLKTRHDR